jgi:glycosyltransferase involved in cell wall biosynthesis
MNLAIVADWLPTYGGAEHVIGAMKRLWPKAPIFTTIAAHGSIGPLISGELFTVPFLQKLFQWSGRHQWLLPFLPKAIENIDLDAYDVIVSSSHAVAKGIIPSSSSVHICYCHTPMRYAWEMEEQYMKDFRIRWPLKNYIRAELSRLRRWDMSTAKRVDHFIANSSETQRRIKRIYGRDSTVIPPPVDDRFFQIPLQPIPYNLSPTTYFLAIGRLVPYKRFDLLIEIANRLQIPLKIGGTGSERSRLKAMAGPTVEFVGFVDDAHMPELYAGATALFFPQIEDAGIVPMEAQACGTPVIGLGLGGLVDVVQDGVTGIFVPEQTVDAFTVALKRFETISWNPETIRNHARQFHEDAFCVRMGEEVRRVSSQ